MPMRRSSPNSLPRECVAMVDHLFVLMLENRSFDHLFGLSGLAGVPRPQTPGYGPGADDRAPSDPPHEFDDVQQQLAAGGMGGFGALGKQALLPAQVPVLTQLAREFVLFDNWFSSMPGPTWPNRFFVHAASSGGLATSPTAFQSAGAVISPTSPFSFENGTLFDLLDRKGLEWRVYHGDVHPQVLALPGMVKRYLGDVDAFRPVYPDAAIGQSDLASDLADAHYSPAYTFIEPNYAVQIFRQFYDGDSQHPCGRVSAGEQLVKYVYEALRASPVWDNSALLVLWDEHGGFYDHVPPPAAAPPGDVEHNRPHGDHTGFAFDRLGVRVPALLVSPHAPKGALGSALFPGQHFDHSSVIRTACDLLGLAGPLTQRDAAATSWGPCLKPSARDSLSAAPVLLVDVNKAKSAAPAKTTSKSASRAMPRVASDVDGFVAGLGLIALDMDREMAATSGRTPLARFAPQSAVQFNRARERSLADPQFNQHLVHYINEVGVRAQAHRALGTTPPTPAGPKTRGKKR
jgi:phospholipase C